MRALELDVKLRGFKMLPGSYHAVIIYKVYYKKVNTLYHIHDINYRIIGKTTYVQMDLSKGNIHVSKTLIVDQIDLLED